MAGDEREEQSFSVTELEEGVTLETGKEYHLTERESTGRLVFRLLDEGGVTPHADERFEVQGPREFTLSGSTDAEGVFEHPEPVPFGDYTLVVGEVQRAIHPQAEGSPPQPLSIADEAIEGGTDLEGSPEDEEDPRQDEAPLVEIERDKGGPAPALLDVDFERVLRAVVTPSSLEGTYAWSAGGPEVSLTPVEGSPELATVKGVSETAEGASVEISCTFAPSAAEVAQGEARHALEVRKRVVEVRLQRSPGAAAERGIQGLSFKVEAEGRELQAGTTGADGKIEVQLAGEETTLTLLHEGAPLAVYRVTQRTEDPEAVALVRGQQRRLRGRGYPLGQSGAEADGVDGLAGRRTARAILEFQADAGLTMDGIAGSRTQGALEG